MSSEFVPFDDMRRRAVRALKGANLPDIPIYLVRNLYGKVSISVSDRVEDNEACRESLSRLACGLSAALGARGYPGDDGVLYVSDSMLETLRDTAKPIGGFHDEVFWEDRLITGNDWWTVGDPPRKGNAKRWTLFSVKGGVGRSTTAAVLARHLARGGERVLVVDLDLESPALSSAMLEPGARPEFGVADWFVEDLVGQGDRVIENMTAAPAWADDVNGAAVIAPAHGRDPGEYLAKLGRVYMDRTDDPWATRLGRMLDGLEARFDPTVVLLDSRSGLHDIAAAAVTDIDARVLLFAANSEAGWADYGLLFRHWRECRLAAAIRGRLSMVSALTPPKNSVVYLNGFKKKTRELFREHLCETPDSPPESNGGISSGAQDGNGSRNPMQIFWNEDIASAESLCALDEAAVESAYGHFFDRFASLANACEESHARPPAPGAPPKNA